MLLLLKKEFFKRKGLPMVKKVLLSSCLLVSSFVMAKKELKNEAFMHRPRLQSHTQKEESENKKKIAEQMGEDSIDLLVDFAVSLGQGRFFQDLQRLNARLKKSLRTVYSLNGGKRTLIKTSREFNDSKEVESARQIILFPGLPLELKKAVIRGMVKRIEQVNVQEFGRDAHLVPWQMRIFEDAHEFALKHLRALSQLHPDEWNNYNNAHFIEGQAFFCDIANRINKELGNDATPYFPRGDAVR